MEGKVAQEFVLMASLTRTEEGKGKQKAMYSNIRCPFLRLKRREGMNWLRRGGS